MADPRHSVRDRRIQVGRNVLCNGPICLYVCHIIQYNIIGMRISSAALGIGVVCVCAYYALGPARESTILPSKFIQLLSLLDSLFGNICVPLDFRGERDPARNEECRHKHPECQCWRAVDRP